jgi:deoxyribose-phosphate aldolase
MKLNKFIDHTCLKQTATTADITKLCNEAKQHDFAAVCIAPEYVSTAKSNLKGTDVKICTVIGFPFGYSTREVKGFEIQDAIKNGADEIDIVQNASYVKNGDFVNLYRDMEFILNSFEKKDIVVKIILESGILTDNEIYKCCEVYSKFEGKINFLKTSTGFAETGATIEAVKIMKKNSPFQIKASGGIKNWYYAEQYIKAGATRLGCSAGIAIIEGYKESLKPKENTFESNYGLNGIIEGGIFPSESDTYLGSY